VVTAVLLWCVCAALATSCARFIEVLAVAIGLAWGFLAAISVVISISHGHVAIFWPTMLPGLVVIPVAAAVSVLPFQILGKRRRDRASGVSAN
jgi:hypothetical protein